MKKRTVRSALRRDVDAVEDVFKYTDVGVPSAIIGWMHKNMGGLVDHWDTLAPLLGIPEEHQEKLGNKLSDRELIQTVSRAWENQQGYIVRVEGKCRIYERRTTRTYIYDETPEEIKYQLGVLKMQDPGTYVRDCGYRHDDVTFYVMEKNDE
jgi:hypothetical protein